MTFNWLMFCPALLLLFLPLEILIRKNIRLKELAHIDFGDPSIRQRAPWRFWMVWVDGLRSFFGAFLLCSAWTIDPMAAELHYVPMVSALLVLALSLAVQMHTRRSDGHFWAPVLYIVGVWLALVSWPLVLVAVAAGAVCMVAFRSLTAFFFFGSAMMAIFGVVVLHAGVWAMIAAILGLQPCLLSLVSGRLLSVPVRIALVKERSRDLPKVRTLRVDEAVEVEV